MTVNRRFRLWIAVAAASGPAVVGCGAMTPAPETPAPAASEPRAGLPRSGLWITYSPRGAAGTTTPNADGSVMISDGDSYPPIFSVRLVSRADDGTMEADLLTPAGFDSRYVRAGDIDRDRMSGDPYSDAMLAGVRLEQTLMHHRPAVRLRIDQKGEADVQRSPELRRHEACERRLLRASIEARLAAAENDEQRRYQREKLQRLDDAPATADSFGVGTPSLLLRLVRLSLPEFVGTEKPGVEPGDGQSRPYRGQRNWRAEQIASHGRAVRSEIDLLSAPDSPAASLCRSLPYRTLSKPRRDTCTIEGVIDSRDGWPIRLTLSRRGEAANGATEAGLRSFERVAPLHGFVPPANPCPAGR